MPRAYLNADGEWVKECIICGQIKPATKEHFYRHSPSSDNLDNRCILCHNQISMTRGAQYRRRGAIIKQQVMLSLGGKCSEPGCHMRYPEDHPGNFDLDHINPSLKQHDKETDIKWIALNEPEFMTRVVPNLQILCCHHHRVRTSQQRSFGGEIYELIHGSEVPQAFSRNPYADHPTLFE